MQFLFIALALAVPAGQEAGLDVAHRRSADSVPLHEVLELTFIHDRRYDDPFRDVSIAVTFVAPSGKKVEVGGFHYGSTEKARIDVHADEKGRRRPTYVFPKANAWKARFAPDEKGAWTYSYVFRDREGARAEGSGSFTSAEGLRRQERWPGRPSSARNPGFLRQDPANPYRWVFPDGTPFNPVGLQDGWFDNSCTGSVLAECALEGPFRLDRKGFPDPPPGPLFTPGPSMNPQNGDVYFRRYGRDGFNLLRFSQKNFSLDLYRDLDHYLVQEAVMVDELLLGARKYGFRIFYGIFGYQPVFNSHPEDAAGMEKVKRFVKYTVDRWGGYVDFWEFLNEQDAADGWYAVMAPYLRSIDPYRHPIATSWERPKLPGIEVSAPHWYGNEDERQSDEVTASHARGWKVHGKPVVVGEQGNAIDRKKATPGVGGVWDPGSALRMRIRLWTAFFEEISFVFWNTSYARDGHSMNIWLGPREREYAAALQAFSDDAGGRLRKVPVELSVPRAARAYGLASPARAAAYIHHFADHREALRGLRVTLDVPKAGKAYWYAPETAAILGSADAPAGRRTFEAPAFAVDIALLVTPGGAPDFDRDGIPNDADPDDDGDGAPDAADAFPLEAEEWADRDGDLIGDNLDADRDADGKGDDEDGDGTPDHEEMDADGDGVPRAGVAPWDAFPLDPKEWRDTDGDGVGDNSDADDDGDGAPDVP
jgi:hypothetical protein